MADLPVNIDTSSLGPLPSVPAAGSGQTPEKLRALAAQFESLLLGQMMRDMKQSMFEDDEDKENGLGGGPLADTMFSELSMALSRAGGMGLSNSLMGPLMNQAGLTTGDADASQTDLSQALISSKLMLPAQQSSSAVSPAFISAVLMSQMSQMTTSPSVMSSKLTSLNALSATGMPPLGLSASDLSAMTLSTPGSGLATAVLSSELSPAPLAEMPSARPGEVTTLPSPDTMTASMPGRLSSAYGWRRDPLDGDMKFHKGQDLAMPVGQDVPAARPGQVTFAGQVDGYGLTVVVKHDDHVSTRYAHLSEILVKRGDQVGAGQTLARSGSTGRSTGPHLHFEVLEDGQAVDPSSAW